MAKDPVCGMFVEEGERSLNVTPRRSDVLFLQRNVPPQFQAPELALRLLKILVAVGATLSLPVTGGVVVA